MPQTQTENGSVDPLYRDPQYKISPPTFDYGDGSVGIYFADSQYTTVVVKARVQTLLDSVSDGYLLCTVCTRTLPRQEFLRKKSVDARGGKGYHCSECRQRKVEDRHSKREQLLHDRALVHDHLTCPDCDKQPYAYPGSLNQHIFKVHGSRRGIELQIYYL